MTATADAVAGGASTGFEVAGVLGWTRRKRRFDELDLFNQILAIHETVAHLEVLVERGWLTRTIERRASRTTRAPELSGRGDDGGDPLGDGVGLLLRPASTITRTSCSVPDGRSRMRPSSPRSAGRAVDSGGDRRRGATATRSPTAR